MLLFEFEGKTLLRDYGIPTPSGIVLTASQSLDVLPFGSDEPLMLKAQILAGARGKGGGIRSVANKRELKDELTRLFSTRINDHNVEQILIEQKVQFERERYLGILIDGETILLVVGRSGGVEVESFASEDKDSFAEVPIDPLYGLSDYQVRNALESLSIPSRLWAAYADVARRLVRLFRERDAVLAEINPLVERADGSLLALDARIVVDDGALHRQPALAAIRDARLIGDDLQAKMQALEIQYLPLGGSIGLLSSGAGMGVAIMDWVAREGERLTAFVDIDYAIMSGNTEPAIRLVLNTLNSNAEVKAIIVNFTSCGLRLDTIAEHLIQALRSQPDNAKPIVLHLQGNRAQAAHRLLNEAGLIVVDKLGDAVRQAARIAKGASA
jgi:succinyl-CoA synthetase beta subunit